MSLYDNFLTSYKTNLSYRKMFLFQPEIPVDFDSSHIIETTDKTVSVINFKHLLKDTIFNNMLDGAGYPLTLKYTETNTGMKYYNLPLTFPLTEMNPEIVPQRPFLLIPLFKILDPSGKEVNYKYFEADDYNQLEVLPNGGPCYLGAKRWPTVQDHRLTLNIKGVIQVNLSQPMFVSNNGYLILKDHHSDCVMVYVGIFIDEGATKGFLNTKFGEIYKQYIQKNSQKEYNTQESDISLELEFNMCKFQHIDEEYDLESTPCITKYDNTLGFHLGFPTLNSPSDLRVYLKGYSLNGELFFQISKYLNDEIFDNGVCYLYFPEANDVINYENFLDKLQEKEF